MSATNTVVWIDIPARDLERARAFYSAVLGADVTKQAHEGFQFAMLPHAEESVSGCIFVSPEAHPSETGVLVYLNVNGRMAEAVEAVRSNGGRVVTDKHEIGPYGYRAVIVDTEGNRVALHSQANS